MRKKFRIRKDLLFQTTKRKYHLQTRLTLGLYTDKQKLNKVSRQGSDRIYLKDLKTN